ncbi:hypothetical protein Tco_0399797 [Tanacetum coccineum]
MAMKISNPMRLDSYTNSMCLESWGHNSYTRVLIEINACNDCSNNLVMAVPKLEGNGYTKKIIRIEYKWKPPRCSTCLIYGHLLVDCPKVAPIRVMNSMDKGKGKTSGADDKGFMEVKKKNSGEQQILEGKLVLVDDDGKPLEKVDYPNNSDSDDEVKPVKMKLQVF